MIGFYSQVIAILRPGTRKHSIDLDPEYQRNYIGSEKFLRVLHLACQNRKQDRNPHERKKHGIASIRQNSQPMVGGPRRDARYVHAEPTIPCDEVRVLQANTHAQPGCDSHWKSEHQGKEERPENCQDRVAQIELLFFLEIQNHWQRHDDCRTETKCKNAWIRNMG